MKKIIILTTLLLLIPACSTSSDIFSDEISQNQTTNTSIEDLSGQIDTTETANKLQTETILKGYKIVAELVSQDIVVYAKEKNGLYEDFKIEFKRSITSRPSWRNVLNPTWSPQIIYDDINQDGIQELTIILTNGYGTGVLEQEVYVFHVKDNDQLVEVLVDNPRAVVLKNTKTKLSADKAEVSIDNKQFTVDIEPFEISPENLFEDISFGGSIHFEVENNLLLSRIGGQISPASYIGEIVIVYEYRDKMYQAKTIEFQPAY